MSSNIWTQCGAKFNVARLTARAHRVVEAQHRRSTRKLVDSDEEHAVLEQALDDLKPAVPPDLRGYHFLLAAPFRYPPLPYGSRFGTRAEQSLWYGSERASTAFSEVAYYRLLFLDGTAADLGSLRVEMTSFHVNVRSRRAVDLTRPPFSQCESRISSKTSYDDAQQLGRDMRQAGVEAFRYLSARDPEGRTNLALFVPAFAGKRPLGLSTWHCFANRERVEFTEKNYFKRVTYTFLRQQFEVAGRLPAPST